MGKHVFAGLLAFVGIGGFDYVAADTVLEEIVVTAQKREQKIEDVPATVSLMNSESVRDYLGAAENVRALAGRVPGLNIESSNGRTQPRFYVRGQGNIDFDNNANQPVSMVFDEVALENNVLRSLPLFDIERVEVLKGPQGTLFGRNTNAGIFKVDSVAPTDELDGYVQVGLGSRDTLATEMAISNQIADVLSARISIKYQERDDWIDNTAAGTSGDDFGAFDETAYRLQFMFYPTDYFTALLKLHGFHQDGSHPQVFYANAIQVGDDGLRSGFDEEVASHDGGAGMEMEHFGGSLKLEWDLGETVFTSITGYDAAENFQSADVDGGLTSFDPADIGALGRQVFFGVATGDGLDDHHQLTQELRVGMDRGGNYWQFGLYFFDEEIDVLSRDFALNFSDIVNQNTRSIAVFGQVEVPLSDRLTATSGLRFTDDKKELSVIPGPNSFSPADSIQVEDEYINWDLGFTFDVNDDVNLYTRISNGSRGPVTLGRFGFTSSADTETSLALEGGFRSTILDGRGRFSSAAFVFENRDQQLTATGGVANVNQLLNADKVTGAGFEATLDLIVNENLYLSGNISYTDTEIEDAGLKDDLCGSSPTCTTKDPIVGSRVGPFGPVTEVSIDGNPLPRTPKWMANVTLNYSVPVESGSIYFNMDWNYRDESNLFLHESVEFVAEERWVGGLRLGYMRSDEKFDVALVGRNITDEITVDGALNFLNLTAFINEPAYWGVDFRYNLR